MARRRSAALAATVAVLAVVALSLAIAAPPASAASPLTIRIINHSGVPDAQVFVLATADGPHAASIPVNGTGVPLTSAGIRQVSPGVNGTGGTYEFTTTDYRSGSFWLSYCSPVGNTPRPSPMTATQRFDQVELTYNGTADQSVWADLTAVSMWGLPIDLAFYNGGTRLTQYDRTNGSRDDIVGALSAAGVQSSAFRLAPNGQFLRVISPVILASAYPSMQPYVTSLAGKAIQVQGRFLRGGDPTTGPYSYAGTFEPDGSITLTGTISSPSGQTSGQPVRVQGNWLWDAVPGMPGFGIYMQNGPYSVGGAIPNGGALANDVYGAIYRDLVAGLAFGYWGGKYGNDSASFTMDPRTGAFQNARATPDPFSPAWNVYEAAITQHGSAYGVPFGDTFVTEAANPLVNGPTNVSVMEMTLRADGASCGAAANAQSVHSTGVYTVDDPSTEDIEVGKGLTILGGDDADDADTVVIDEDLSPSRSSAPVVEVPSDDPFSLVVGGLPASTRMRQEVFVNGGWAPVTVGVTTTYGLLRLPAIEAAESGRIPMRFVTRDGRDFHLVLRVVEAPAR